MLQVNLSAKSFPKIPMLSKETGTPTAIGVGTYIMRKLLAGIDHTTQTPGLAF